MNKNCVFSILGFRINVIIKEVKEFINLFFVCCCKVIKIFVYCNVLYFKNYCDNESVYVCIVIIKYIYEMDLLDVKLNFWIY